MKNINNRFFHQLDKQVCEHLYDCMDDHISGQVDSQVKSNFYDRFNGYLDVRIWEQLSHPLRLDLRTQLIKQIGL